MDLHRREDGILCYLLPDGQLCPVGNTERLGFLSDEEVEALPWSSIKHLCEQLGYEDKPDRISWKQYYLQLREQNE